jgi:hypothetical protein
MEASMSHFTDCYRDSLYLHSAIRIVHFTFFCFMKWKYNDDKSREQNCIIAISELMMLNVKSKQIYFSCDS